MIKYEKGYDNLALAIVTRAIEDYKLAHYVHHIDKEPSWKVIVEVENFLKSDWFTVLCDLDGDVVLEHLRKEFE